MFSPLRSVAKLKGGQRREFLDSLVDSHRSLEAERAAHMLGFASVVAQGVGKLRLKLQRFRAQQSSGSTPSDSSALATDHVLEEDVGAPDSPNTESPNYVDQASSDQAPVVAGSLSLREAHAAQVDEPRVREVQPPVLEDEESFDEELN